jgi:hypothetical protein
MNKYVRERKFIGPANCADLCLDILNHYCLADPDYSEGFLESIYYDDHRLSAYWEKMDGNAYKCKYRVRWYPGTGLLAGGRRQAFLEVKNRIGAARDKQRFMITAERKLLEEAHLYDPALQSLLYAGAAGAGVIIPWDLVPTVSIRYHRRRYVCPHSGSRVCFDTELRTGRINSEVLPANGPITSGLVICEVKSGKNVEWEWAGSLSRAGLRLDSFSKYGELVHAIINGGLSQ